jgi:hypothetical protein
VKGGPLMVGRSVKSHQFYKTQLEKFGFANVFATAAEKDELYSIVRDMEPDLLFIEARYFENATPYLMGELVNKDPKLKIAAVSIEKYSDDLAMSFIANGVKYYVTFTDGPEEFKKGMAAIRDGRE